MLWNSTSPDLIYTSLSKNWKQAIHPYRFVFFVVHLFRPVMYLNKKDKGQILSQTR